MTMAADKQDKVLNFSSEREQSGACSNSAERENNQGKDFLNVPNLRFPQFTDKWKECELQDIADLSKGAGISKDQLSETGESCILYGELYTQYKSEVSANVVSKTDTESTNLVRSKANDVIIPSSGETAIDISMARCVPYDNILLGGDLNIIRLKDQDGRFFSYQLNGVRKLDIAQITQGVSVVHLYGESLKRLKVRYPSKSEQEKISSLLSAIDDRIETQSRIIEDLKQLRSALYYQIFSNIQGNWVTLKMVGDIAKGKQINGSELLDEGMYYVMNGGITPSGYYNKYNTPANTISISEGGNSCGYVQYNSVPFWSGGHCYNLRIKKSFDSQYIFHFLKFKELDIMALRIGSGLPNIQKKDLEHFQVLVPDFTTQKKVAGLFVLINKKEETEMKLMNAWKMQKKYLLQKLFI